MFDYAVKPHIEFLQVVSDSVDPYNHNQYSQSGYHFPPPYPPPPWPQHLTNPPPPDLTGPHASYYSHAPPQQPYNYPYHPQPYTCPYPPHPQQYAPHPPPPPLHHSQFPPSARSHFPPPHLPLPGALTAYSHPPPSDQWENESWPHHPGWLYQSNEEHSYHNFRSNSVFSFKCETKTDFRSKEIANSFRGSDEIVVLGTAVIATSDLNFIKNALHQMIASTDKIQDRLNKMSSLLSHDTKMLSNTLPRAPIPSKLNMGSSAISLMSIESPTLELFVPPKVHTSAEVTNRERIAETKVFTSGKKLDAPNTVKTCLPPWSMFAYFEFGNMNGDDTMLGNFFGMLDELNIYKMFDILLERNDRKIFEKYVFIFDPGGETINAEDGQEVWSINGDSQLSDADLKKNIFKWPKK